MSGNAYACDECGKVAPQRDVERGLGQWIRVQPVSLVLMIGDIVIRDEAMFCGPDCVRAAMSKVKRLP